MRTSSTRLGALAVLLFWCGWMLVGGGTSLATLPTQKQAKDAGFPATNCQYCHIEKLPKKGQATHNERGQWLIAEKTRRNAKVVDGAWLKDYPGDKK